MSWLAVSMARKPAATASSTRRVVASFFQAVPYMKGGRETLLLVVGIGSGQRERRELEGHGLHERLIDEPEPHFLERLPGVPLDEALIADDRLVGREPAAVLGPHGGGELGAILIDDHERVGVEPLGDRPRPAGRGGRG